MASLAEQAVERGRQKAAERKAAQPDTVARDAGRVMVRKKVKGGESLSSGNKTLTVKSKYRDPKEMLREIGLAVDKLDPSDPKNKIVIDRLESYMDSAMKDIQKYLED